MRWSTLCTGCSCELASQCSCRGGIQALSDRGVTVQRREALKLPPGDTDPFFEMHPGPANTSEEGDARARCVAVRSELAWSICTLSSLVPQIRNTVGLLMRRATVALQSCRLHKNGCSSSSRTANSSHQMLTMTVAMTKKTHVAAKQQLATQQGSPPCMCRRLRSAHLLPPRLSRSRSGHARKLGEPVSASVRTCLTRFVPQGRRHLAAAEKPALGS
jgi:hypothetical protein